MRYQIEGGSLPVLTVELEAGEAMVSESGGRTWMKGNVSTDTKADGGLGKSLGRMLSGESLFLNHYRANGKCEIAFTSSFPGKIIAKTLAPGESVICQKRAFLCATEGTQLSIFFRKKVSTGLFGGEGFIMQKVTGPGIAFFEIDGYCKEYDLAPGEEIICDTGVVAIMDESCKMDVRMVGSVKNALFGGEGLVDTVVSDPGKVMLQTMPIYKVASAIQPFIVTGNK